MDDFIAKTITLTTPLPIMQQDEKGRITTGVAQDTNKNGTAGRPCLFCQHSEEYMQKTEAYLQRHRPKGTDKITIPWIEELALELDTTDVNIVNWAKKVGKDGELEHPEFSSAVAVLKQIQKLRLQQRALGRYQPIGAISLLKFNHGATETTKNVLAGDKDEPIEVKIVEEQVRELPE